MSRRRVVVTDGCSVTYRARKGAVMGAGSVPVATRWDSRTIDFPPVVLVERRGLMRYSAAWGHALLCDNDFCLEHSLVISLHPDARASVESRWRTSLKASPALEEVRVESPVFIAANEGAGTWGQCITYRGSLCFWRPSRMV